MILHLWTVQKCKINYDGLTFCFRFCSFRRDNLTRFYNDKLEKIFDVSFLEKYKNLYCYE